MTTTSLHNLTRYKRGCRCPECTAANRAWLNRQARLSAYGQWNGWVDATGTQRRIRALMRNGWSLAAMGARLGCSKQVMAKKLHAPRGKVYADTVTEIRALYDALWNQPPPGDTRHARSAATTTRRYAAERGWPPPLAWDDDTIDDPSAAPADGWEPRKGVRRYGVLADNAAYLLAAGESYEHVAVRLGVSEKTLDTTLMRAQQRAEAADVAA